MQKNIVFNIDPEKVFTKNQKFDFTSSALNKESKQIAVKKEDAPDNSKTSVNYMSDFKTPLQTDYWIYRIVVSSLALTIISSIVGTVWLEANNKKVPEILIALGTGSLGALAGILAPTPSKE